MKWFIGILLKTYLRAHEKIHDRVMHSLAIRYFDGLHPKNIFHYRSQFFLENLSEGDVVLDVACGTGRILKEVSKTIEKGIGIDWSLKNIESCESSKATNLDFIRADISAFDYDSLKKKVAYNKVIFSHILEHVEDVPGLLAKVGGDQLLICVPSQENWYRQWLKSLNLPYMTDPTHFREYTRQMLKEELDSSNYAVQFMGFNSEGEIICVASRKK